MKEICRRLRLTHFGLCFTGIVLPCVIVLAPSATARKKPLSFEAGLRQAIEKNDIRVCGSIGDSWERQGRVYGPYLAQRQCRIEYAAAKNDPSVCRTLSRYEKGPPEDLALIGGLDVESLCLMHLARSLRRLDLCDQLLPNEKFRNLQAIWRENCREQAI